MTFLRYVVVQLMAYAIDMGGFLLLTHHALLSPLWSNGVAKLAAGLFAFAAHRHFTFKAGEDQASGQALRYFLLLALNVPLSSGVLALLLPWLAPAALAKLAADVVILGITYGLSRSLVFRRPAATPVDSART